MPLKNNFPSLPINQIINGDCQINQNGGTGTVDFNTASLFVRTDVFPSVDNFEFYFPAALNAVIDVAQLEDHPILGATGTSTFITVTTPILQAAIPAAALVACGMTAPISIPSFAAQAATPGVYACQFQIKSSKTGIYTGVLCAANGGQLLYTFEFTVQTANAWQQIVIGIPDPLTSQLGVSGAFLGVVLAAGANTRIARLNQWAFPLGASPIESSTEQVNFLDTAGATIQLTDFLLTNTLGAVQFPRLSFGDSLARAQQLFYTTAKYGAARAPRNSGNLDGALYTRKNVVGATGLNFYFSAPQAFANGLRLIQTDNPQANNAQARNVTGGADCTLTSIPNNNTSTLAQKNFTVVSTGDVGSGLNDNFAVHVSLDGNTYL